ncbi:MAG: hypothetical protein J6M18_00480 [Actinomycetaceae bacterium]|nr:hypothetical protein [Actinomycetaceae bacterium]
MLIFISIFSTFLLGFLFFPHKKPFERPSLFSSTTHTQKKKKKKIRKKNKESKVDLGLIVSEVSTRLQSGASTENAWKRTLERTQLPLSNENTDNDGVPPALRYAWAHKKVLGDKEMHAAIPAAIAVCRLGSSSGAPLANVLDACAQGISESADAHGARRAALAGPVASARTIALLPLIGLFLGSLLGAHPIDFLFGTLFGNICLFLSFAFEITGIIWVYRLKKHAEFSY